MRFLDASIMTLKDSLNHKSETIQEVWGRFGNIVIQSNRVIENYQ